MMKRFKHSHEPIAGLALSFIDLRAHFEAQLRTVIRAEQCLLTCRSTTEEGAFDAALQTLRAEVHVVSNNNKNIKSVIDHIDAETRGLVFTQQGDTTTRSR